MSRVITGSWSRGGRSFEMMLALRSIRTGAPHEIRQKCLTSERVYVKPALLCDLVILKTGFSVVESC